MIRSIRLKVCLPLVLLPLSPVASGAENKEIAECAAKENAVARLNCFDELSAKHGLAPKTDTKKVEGSGTWSISSRTDPLTDKSVHIAILEATSGQGRFGETINLMVRCANNETDMYIDWKSFLGSNATRTTYRIGKAAAKTSNWTLSTDKKAAFFPTSPVPVLKEIIAGGPFVANVTPYNESPITAVFETDGAASALADIRKACSW